MSSTVTQLPDRSAAVATENEIQALRILEAMLFSASEPITEDELADRMPANADVASLLEGLKETYEPRGVNLVRVAGGWAFRTAGDLSHIMRRYAVEMKKLSRAAMETLSIIAYHQPVTRAEIEDIRGVSTSKGTLDVLLETGWIRMRGRRRTPGRPVTYGTTPAFLDHFGLESVKDLPGLDELKGSGIIDSAVPADFRIPSPNDDADLFDDEEPLEESEDDAEAAADVDGDIAFEEALKAVEALAKNSKSA